jgi:hypothetical protein
MGTTLERPYDGIPLTISNKPTTPLDRLKMALPRTPEDALIIPLLAKRTKLEPYTVISLLPDLMDDGLRDTFDRPGLALENNGDFINERGQLMGNRYWLETPHEAIKVG